MEKYLILLDLDGTLLNDKKTICSVNKNAITELIKLGHEVIIVTGRAHYRSQEYYDDLGLRSLLVNRNASHIHAPIDIAHVEKIEFIDQDVVQIILNHSFMNYVTKMFFENKNKIYVHSGDDEFYRQYPLCDCIDLKQEFPNKVNLISFFIPKDKLANTTAFLDEMKQIQYETFPFGEEVIFNIYPNHINKSLSIEYLSNYYQVPVERIIAIGDEKNDIEFIKAAGIGVAMKNAIDEVKQNAKMITKESNNESGVGLFLKEFFHLNI